MNSPNSRSGSVPLGKRILFALLPLILLLGLGELVARFMPGDFEVKRAFFYTAGGHEEYFGTTKVSIPYRLVPPYHWVPAARTPITNNRGFRGRDWNEEKPAGVIRIASLGDSCTLGGQESYSERLDRLLREALGTNKYEVLNAGVGSSSTHQMLQIFEQHVLPMKPDWVVLFLGWNDRWVHDGTRDATHDLAQVSGMHQTRAGAREFLRKHSRLFKGLLYLFQPKVEQRVPPEETARNLRELARICREKKMRLVLMTSPDGNPDEAILNRFNENKPVRDWDSDLYDLWKNKAAGPLAVWRLIHDTYNNTVRDVARSEKVELIDLDKQIPGRRKLYTEPPHYLFKDGIHFAEVGLQEMARAIGLELLPDAERRQLASYVESPAYYATNAFVFKQQFQYADAELFAQKADQLGLTNPPAGWDTLKRDLQADGPFYNRFNEARILLSNRGNPTNVLAMYKECLAMKPGDAGLRIETAELAKGNGKYDEGMNILAGIDWAQAGAQLQHRALWTAAECAHHLGRQDLTMQYLNEIARRFPEDQQALEILNSAQRR